MPSSRILAPILFLIFFILPVNLQASDDQQREAQALVDQAVNIIEDFYDDPNYEWMKNDLKTAKAVLVIPQSLQGAFFVGGAGGSGVLVARDTNNVWSNPAFYTMGSISFGLQFGADASQIVLMVMSDRGMASLLSTSFKLGAGATVTAGPLGGGTKTTTADIMAYSKSKGIFGGVSVEGAVISVRENLNSNYYNQFVNPGDILIERSVNNPASQKLRDTVQRLADLP